MKRWRREDKGDVVFGKGRELDLEGRGKGLGFVKEFGVREAAACGGVDEESGGGGGCGVEERECVLNYGNGL